MYDFIESIFIGALGTGVNVRKSVLKGAILSSTDPKHEQIADNCRKIL